MKTLTGMVIHLYASLARRAIRIIAQVSASIVRQLYEVTTRILVHFALHGARKDC